MAARTSSTSPRDPRANISPLRIHVQLRLRARFRATDVLTRRNLRGRRLDRPGSSRPVHDITLRPLNAASRRAFGLGRYRPLGSVGRGFPKGRNAWLLEIAFDYFAIERSIGRVHPGRNSTPARPLSSGFPTESPRPGARRRSCIDPVGFRKGRPASPCPSRWGFRKGRPASPCSFMRDSSGAWPATRWRGSPVARCPRRGSTPGESHRSPLPGRSAISRRSPADP